MHFSTESNNYFEIRARPLGEVFFIFSPEKDKRTWR